MNHSNYYSFEVCANSVASCIAAQKGGANRVELCAAIPEGGTTPSAGAIACAREAISIDLNVIIRPRGGDFLYSDLELRTMERDIAIARHLGADGIVVGCLNADADIDIAATKRLIDAADGLPVTFHRAFDRCRDPFTALSQLIDLGVARILTSGQQPTAPQGAKLIDSLVKRACGNIAIMAGCGVNETNIAALARATNAREFHFSAREPLKSRMKWLYDASVAMGTPGVDESIVMQTSSERVAATIEALMLATEHR